MLDFIMNLIGLFWRWIFYTIIALLLIYFFLSFYARRMLLGDLFGKCVDMVWEWIKDAFRD